MLVTQTQSWFDLATTPNKTIFVLWPDKWALAIHRIARAVKTRSFKKQGENVKTKQNAGFFLFHNSSSLFVYNKFESKLKYRRSPDKWDYAALQPRSSMANRMRKAVTQGDLHQQWLETRAASLAWSCITALARACTAPSPETWFLSHAPSRWWTSWSPYPVPWSSRASGTDVPFSFTRWTRFLLLHVQPYITPQLNRLQHTWWQILKMPSKSEHGVQAVLMSDIPDCSGSSVQAQNHQRPQIQSWAACHHCWSSVPILSHTLKSDTILHSPHQNRCFVHVTSCI